MPNDLVVTIKIKGEVQTMTRKHHIGEDHYDLSYQNAELKAMVDKAIADFKQPVKKVSVSISCVW